MQDWLSEHGLWAAAGLALAVVIAAGVADWLRTRRSNLDSPGWIPWRGIQVTALFAALLLAVVAMKTG